MDSISKMIYQLAVVKPTQLKEEKNQLNPMIYHLNDADTNIRSQIDFVNIFWSAPPVLN